MLTLHVLQLLHGFLLVRLLGGGSQRLRHRPHEPLRGAMKRFFQLAQRARFFEEIYNIQANGGASGFEVSKAGQDDDLMFRMDGAELFKQFDPADSGEIQIDD